MRPLLLLALCLVPADPGAAQPRSANTLTPQEVSAGWVLLFDGHTDFGWQPRGAASWAVGDGILTGTGGDGFLATTTEFADFELRADVWLDGRTNSGLFLRGPLAGEITPMNAYEVNINDSQRQWPSGSINLVGRARTPVKTAGRWSAFHVRALGDRLTVSVNGRRTLDARSRRQARGVIGLQHAGSGTVRFRNVKLKPLSLQPLFNGRDLSGWKEIPGRNSVYSVTPEGWMNVKNGNGDIQTERTFGDFVLQLDIISNGTHLNSGVFFRANPGLFWSGYESQIRNQWEGDDRTKPVDYGTGGVYNRQPARRVVSSDHEWFTMTVVAHGYHIATWVNGIQVADFQDTRPVNEGNAREGSRKKPGVITLQGHDPTTDLSFRRIRAAEMPPAR